MSKEWVKVTNKKYGNYYYHLGQRVSEETYIGSHIAVKNGKIFAKTSNYFALLAKSQSELAEYSAVLFRAAAEKKTYTVAQIKAMVDRNRIEILIANMGLTPEELAKDLNTSVENLLNPKNWKKSTTIYTAPETGRSYLFEWTYEGETLYTEIYA